MADTPELPVMDVTEEDRIRTDYRYRCSCALNTVTGLMNDLHCRERQLRQAHATIAALRAPAMNPPISAEHKALNDAAYSVVSWFDYESPEQRGPRIEKLRASLLPTDWRESIRPVPIEGKPAPQSGEAMEAEVNKCVEAIWSVLSDPRKSGTKQKHAIFELLMALLLSTHNPLLERIRVLEALLAKEVTCMCGHPRDSHEDGGDNCNEDVLVGDGIIDNCPCEVFNAASFQEAENLSVKLAAAEAKVRELEARNKELLVSSPLHRWECFFCEFRTSDRAEAEAHFGDRDDAEEFKPICKWWSNMDDQERKEQFQQTILQLNEATANADELEAQVGAARAEGWIDCRDEMPTAFGKDYLVSVLLMQSTRRRTQVSTLWESGWGNVFREEYVTHWQPKPADPLALLSEPKGASN